MVAFILMLRDLRILGRALAGLAICVALTLVWGSYFLPETFEQRVLAAVRSGSIEEAGTFEDRVALMREALDMVDDTMIVGLGVDQYRAISRFGAPVHNTYLLLWAEGGLPGLVAWVALMAMVVLAPVAVARREPLVGATGFAVGLVFLLIGFTTAHMYQRYSVVPLHLVMALVLAAPHAGLRRTPQPRLPANGAARWRTSSGDPTHAS
jgi:O-antigen ligase